MFYRICCYNSGNNECFAKVNNNDADCPKDSLIYNNCGMAGVYQPITTEICTEISLVQGYCCYANFTDGSSACLRTKELNKDKDSATNQMKEYFSSVKLKYQKERKDLTDLDFDKVKCEGYNLKNYLFFIYFLN